MLYGGICKVCKKKKKNEGKNPQTLVTRISDMAGAIFLKC